MSCFKTSEAGFKSKMKSLNLVDEFLNIPNGSLGVFRSYVTTWSKYAKEKYGVDERLFYDEQSGTKAVPNKKAFQLIDWKKGVKYKENEWVGQVQDFTKGDEEIPADLTEDRLITNVNYQADEQSIIRDSERVGQVILDSLIRSKRVLWFGQGQRTGVKLGEYLKTLEKGNKGEQLLFGIEGFTSESGYLSRTLREEFNLRGSSYNMGLAIAERVLQSEDNFIGRVYSSLKGKGLDGTVGLEDDLNGDTLYFDEKRLMINLSRIERLTRRYTTYEEFTNAIDLILTEELIHAITQVVADQKDLDQIYEELSNEEIDNLKKIYNFKAETPFEIRNNIVNEYLRVIVQDRLFGTVTEGELKPSVFNLFRNVVDYLVGLFKSNPTRKATEVVDRIENFIKDNNGRVNNNLYQTQSVSRKRITSEVKEQLLTFLQKVNPNFKVEVIDDLSVNGLVNFSTSLIQLKKGQEDIALPEEVSHVWLESLTDKKLKKDLMDDVVRTKMYQWVLREYREVYGNDYSKMKSEAAAKLISLWIQDREAFNYWSGSEELNNNLGSLIRRVINWIKKHLKNPYSKSALRILKGSTEGLDIALAQGSWYQLNPLEESRKFESINEENITKYGKIFINLNNTLLDYANWKANPVGKKNEKLVKSTFWSDFTLRGELDRYYENAQLTKLGRELKEKIEVINPQRVIIFTDAPITDKLIERLEDEFGQVSIIRTGYNIHQTLFDEFGNPVDQIISGSDKEAFIMEQVNNNPTSNLLFIDNQSTITENQSNLKVKLYDNSSATYTDVQTKIRQEALAERNKEFNQDVVEELSKIDKENLYQLARQSMNMVKNQVKKLEGKGLEDLSKLFRDKQGNLILPLTDKANLLTRLLEDVDTFEQGLLNFVQSIESTRMFFHNANQLDFSALKELEDQDKALKEAAFLMRMILSWKQWVKEMRPYVNDTKVMNRVLNAFEGELERANIKLNDIAVNLLSKNLSEQWRPFNEGKKKLLDEGVISKEQYEDSIYTPEKLVRWLIGVEGDIKTGSAYMENALRTKDPIIQAISRRLELSMIGGEMEHMKRMNQWQVDMWDLSDKIGMSDEKIGKKITYVDQENYWEDGVMKQRPTLYILNEWQGLWTRKTKEDEVKKLRNEWQEAKQSGQPFEEKELIYLKAKEDLDQWIQDNWYDEVTNEGKNIYKEFGIADDILELAKERQQEIYKQIREWTNILQRTMITEQMEANANKEVERLVRELRLLRNEYTPEGELKQGDDLLIARKLKDKGIIDRQIYDYEFQTQDFLNAINEQILSIADENTQKILLELIDTKNLKELYDTAKQIAPQSFIDWLERNTRVRYSESFYEERTNLIKKIKELNPDTNIDLAWQELTNLTSFLRDKDMVLDGSDSTPEIQDKVKQFELILQDLKGETNPEIIPLIQRLSEIQGKRYTDYYKEVMYDQLKDIYTISSNENFLTLINSKDFREWLPTAPQEFQDWFVRNHYSKEVWDQATESKAIKIVPTYIWMKNEPTNSGDILLIPGWKYNKRILKDEAKIEFNGEVKDIKLKTTKIDWVTWNPLQNSWLPKSDTFKNKEYQRLKESKDEKDQLLFQYLTNVLNKHIEIQLEGNYDSRIGFIAPRFHTKYTEGRIGGAIKRGFKAMSETLQPKEEGTGGEQKKERSVWKKMLAYSGIETQEQVNQVKRTDYLGNEFKTIYTPYTQYLVPEETTKNLVLSLTNYSNGVEKVKALIKDLPQLNLLEQVFDQFKPKKKGTVNQYGEMIDASTDNRANLLNHIIEKTLYSNVKDFELGQGVDRAANIIKKTAVVGSQSDLNLPNAVKNWLQGQAMNFLFVRDGGWGTRKTWLKAAKDHRTSYANFIYEMGKKNKSVDYHILSFFNPLLERRIADFNKSARSTELQDRAGMFSSTASEFSVTSTLLYSHLYNQDVLINGEPKKLYDAFTVVNGVLSIKPNTTLNGEPLTIEYVQELKLRFKMMMEDVLGKQWNQTLSQRYTVWQSLEFFKKFFIPMLRKRFFLKRDNIELGETEGTYISLGKWFIRQMHDWINGSQFANTLTPQEQLNVKAARDEVLMAIATLFIISYLFGFDDDDEDKYKKLEDRSWLANMALLIAINTKRETDSLVPVPFVSLQNSVYPPVLNETYNFITSPFVGFTVINEGRKMLDSFLLLATGDDKAYYDRDMPAYLIQEGDSKFEHYLWKVAQIDNFLYQASPDAKIQVIVNASNR